MAASRRAAVVFDSDGLTEWVTESAPRQGGSWWQLLAATSRGSGVSWEGIRCESSVFHTAWLLMSWWWHSGSAEWEPMALIEGHSWSACLSSMKSPRQTERPPTPHLSPAVLRTGVQTSVWLMNKPYIQYCCMKISFFSLVFLNGWDKVWTCLAVKSADFLTAEHKSKSCFMAAVSKRSN